jgi:predicted aconitase with swiveling domain
LRTAPVGIVLLKRDAIVVTGAMVADALYGLSCPVVLAREGDWSKIAGASRLRIEARLQDASITIA